TGKMLAAFAVCRDDSRMDVGRVALHPAHQRRPEIEADARIVVDDFGDAFVGSKNARGRVRGVTFGRDAFVPVVIRVGRILQLDFFEPGVLARRLIEVSVDTDLSIHSLAPSSLAARQSAYLINSRSARLRQYASFIDANHRRFSQSIEAAAMRGD